MVVVGWLKKSSRYCKRKHTSGLATQASLQGYAALMNFERPSATSEVKKCIHYEVPSRKKNQILHPI